MKLQQCGNKGGLADFESVNMEQDGERAMILSLTSREISRKWIQHLADHSRSQCRADSSGTLACLWELCWR